MKFEKSFFFLFFFVFLLICQNLRFSSGQEIEKLILNGLDVIIPSNKITLEDLSKEEIVYTLDYLDNKRLLSKLNVILTDDDLTDDDADIFTRNKLDNHVLNAATALQTVLIESRNKGYTIVQQLPDKINSYVKLLENIESLYPCKIADDNIAYINAFFRFVLIYQFISTLHLINDVKVESNFGTNFIDKIWSENFLKMLIGNDWDDKLLFTYFNLLTSQALMFYSKNGESFPLKRTDVAAVQSVNYLTEIKKLLTPIIAHFDTPEQLLTEFRGTDYNDEADSLASFLLHVTIKNQTPAALYKTCENLVSQRQVQ